MDDRYEDSKSHQVGNAPVDDVDSTANNNLATASSSSTQGDNANGIDIRQALEILSSRTPHDHHEDGHENAKHCCADVTKNPPPDVLRNMGQTIDMFAPSTGSSIDAPKPPSTSQTTSSNNQVDPSERRKKIRDSLRGLSIVASLKMLLTAQEDRVRTYRLYDEALGKVLLSNRLTDYPPACAAATAAFSVLSDTVAAVRDELSNRIELLLKNNDGKTSPTSLALSSIIESINSLQSLEREKLQITAAYHLEQIRANNLKESKNLDDNDDTKDSHELSLLNKGISDMRSRNETCRSNINGIIEDLRCTLVELMEEGEDE
ncbi:unnamed protein product [Pseudo-nitzschia multistriata]|uniref:Uncharacterized protein n=1 Tax=Pseudo-nitzschia multistriata TaxID=183589 RepID=A0A448ZLK2_9STRA|nr:unnamed protein product [Pseudo-nitzschia multistriata]